VNKYFLTRTGEIVKMSVMDIDELTGYGTTKKLKNGEILFREGEPGKEMYIVIEGCVEISIDQGNKRIILATFMPGDFFGDMSLLEEMPRSGTATATKPTTMVALDQANFRRVLSVNSELAWRVMKGLSARIRNQNRELALRLSGDLNDMSARLSASAKEIASAISNIATSAEEIDINEKLLADNIKQVQSISEEITKSLEFIKEVADQTNMLGINAAIEAARAGEQGRGFTIVADRIRKLSEQSRRNAEDIKLLTGETNKKMRTVINASEDSVAKCLAQASATREVATSVIKVAEMAERLTSLASSL
jgi:methyl-accepting chemotaxis protein